MVDVDSLRTNQLGEQAWATYQRYLEALDRYDLEAWSDFLADEVSVQFNNDEPLVGKATVVEGMAGFWASVQDLGRSLTHEPLNLYGDDRHYALEALNHYDAEGRPRVTVRAVAFTDLDDDGLVRSVRVYQDLAPLYAASSSD